MTTVWFVRHARPNFGNHDDASRELSERGLRDRLRVTEFLMDKNIDAVLSSPYRRAVETVAHFADKQGMEIECIDGFRERRVDCGWIENFDAFARKQWANFDYKLPGGESLREVQRRNLAALREALACYEGKNLAIGSHGTALCTIIHAFCPAFGHADFQRIRALMPWVVQFEFEGSRCHSINSFNLFCKNGNPTGIFHV